jgi:hypothetical protein
LNGGTRLNVRTNALDKAGDGTVPIWSGQPNGIQSVPVPGEHSKLFRSDALRAILAELLGAPRLLAAAPTELSLSPKVVEPSDQLHAALVFPTTATSIQGAITLYRLQLDDYGAVIDSSTIGNPIEITYEGGSAEALTVTFEAPNLRGYYRARFEGFDMNPAEDEFVVQDPPNEAQA